MEGPSGTLLESDLLQGETYDARRDLGNWHQPDYNDAAWKSVQVFAKTDRVVQCHPGHPVRITEVLRPRSVTRRDNGVYICDMGQNFAGVVRLRAMGNAGDRITLRFGEMLHPDGRLMTENLRKARATDTYILRGDPNGEVWTPQFTFHGFQYVEVAGYPGEPGPDSLTGLVLGSDVPTAGSFECSNALVNQLYKNIVWTQRANFVDIPTDCPQRDERMGWTGDAQIYIGSAILNGDVAAFFTKWLVDLNDDQWPDGSYPNFAPRPFNRDKMLFSPGWMEAGVICPYHLLKAYGDTRLVQKHWPNMEAFMAFHEKRSRGKYVYPEASFEDIVPKGGFGDWLNVGKKTPPDLLATMYYGYCASLMAEMARAIERPDRAAHYADVAQKVRRALREHYIAEDGRFRCNAAAYGNGAGYVDGDRGFSGHTQTAYANGIYMNLLDPALEQKAGRYLVGQIEQSDGRLSTGFLGVKPLLPALSKMGYTEVAYQLLLTREYPSWLFEIDNGATTIWERWNSFTKKDGFVAGMNSFSHYSFGSVCEWMFQNMGGIRNPGIAYESILLEPELDRRVRFVKARHQSIRGDILSHWSVQDDRLSYVVDVPANTVATVSIPSMRDGRVLESGRPIQETSDLTVLRIERARIVVRVGSGHYQFVSQLAPGQTGLTRQQSSITMPRH